MGRPGEYDPRGHVIETSHIGLFLGLGGALHPQDLVVVALGARPQPFTEVARHIPVAAGQGGQREGPHQRRLGALPSCPARRRARVCTRDIRSEP